MFFGDLLVRIYPDTEVKNQTFFNFDSDWNILTDCGWTFGISKTSNLSPHIDEQLPMKNSEHTSLSFDSYSVTMSFALRKNNNNAELK